MIGVVIIAVFLSVCIKGGVSFAVYSRHGSSASGDIGVHRRRTDIPWIKPVGGPSRASLSRIWEMGIAEDKLKHLGITLPEVAPAGNYVLYTRSGNTLYLSGHLPKTPPGGLTTGKVGEDLEVREAAQAARLVAINLLTTMKGAVGELDKIRMLKITGFVQCKDGFTEQSAVINGASDLFLEVFGTERGVHARSAVGTNALPLGVCVEIEAIAEVI